MKKLLLIPFFVLLISCSSDDGEPVTCNCIGQWGTEEGVDIEQEIEIECNTENPIYNEENAHLGNGNMPWHWLGCKQ